MLRTLEQERTFQFFKVVAKNHQQASDSEKRSLQGMADVVIKKGMPYYPIKQPIYDLPWTGKNIDLRIELYPLTYEEKKKLMQDSRIDGLVGEVGGKFIFFPPMWGEGPVPIEESETGNWTRLPS